MTLSMMRGPLAAFVVFAISTHAMDARAQGAAPKADASPKEDAALKGDADKDPDPAGDAPAGDFDAHEQTVGVEGGKVLAVAVKLQLEDTQDGPTSGGMAPGFVVVQ